VLAYTIFALIVRKQPIIKLHKNLRPAFIIVAFIAMLRVTLNIVVMCVPHLKPYYGHIALAAFTLPLIFLSLWYGTTLFYLWTGRAPVVSATKAFRDRLLVISAYLMLYLSLRVVFAIVALLHEERIIPLPLKAFGCLLIWSSGFFDSIILGRLFRCHPSKRMLQKKRQVSDDRIRVGQSLNDDSTTSSTGSGGLVCYHDDLDGGACEVSLPYSYSLLTEQGYRYDPV